MLALEFVDEVIDQTVIEIFTTQVRITGRGFDLKDTLFNGQEGHIKSSSTQIEDQHIALALGFLVQTVCNCCGGRFVDDTEDVETSNKTSILGSLTLRIVEVCWHSDNSVVDSASEV